MEEGGRKLFGRGRDLVEELHKMYSHLPHSANRNVWREWQDQLSDARRKDARYWGVRDPRNALKSWGRARLRTLRDPGKPLIKLKKEGALAVKALSKRASVLRRVTPLVKFGGKLVGKVLKPLNIIASYQSSKARTPVGKLTSVALSTFLTKNPVGLVADLVTDGQVTNFVDGTVAGVESVGDEKRLADWADANRKGENGWVLQAMQHGDVIGAGLYDGWERLTHGD